MGAQEWLEEFVRQSKGVAGTVHLRSGPDELSLAAAVHIPEPVRRIVQRIPRGKGMAGLAFERDQPISSCNIKTDTSGQVRPGARAVDAQAAIALPVHDEGGRVRAVVGVAFRHDRELSDVELTALAKAAASLPPQS